MLGIATVDVGSAMWAMHSARGGCGSRLYDCGDDRSFCQLVLKKDQLFFLLNNSAANSSAGTGGLVR